MKARDRLRIAIQKSGRLHDASMSLLTRCGLAFRQSRDKLFCYGESLPVDLLLVRDDDIPGLVRDGVADLGMVGRNESLEQSLAWERAGQGPGLRELRALGFGDCRLSLAIPQEQEWQSPAQLQGLRIATSYPALLSDWLARQQVQAQVIELAGSVEIAPRLGTADCICDLVSSGATLVANQLKEVAELMRSEAVLIGPLDELADERGALVELLLRRLDGVLKVRESRLVLLKAPTELLEQIHALLPAADQPTVVPLNGDGRFCSLQVVCHTALTWEHLEALKAAGGENIVVVPVERMLA